MSVVSAPQELESELVDRLLDYLRQPSVSATGQGFPQATELAVHELQKAGLEARSVDMGGRPFVVGHRAGPPGTPTVLIYGHYDVQPPGDPAEWTSEPFTPTIRAGRIYGRGSGDNKGQHFAHLQALRLLMEERGCYPCSVVMVLDGEEEIGSPTLERFVRAHRDELACDLVIWSDGPVHDSGQWTLVHGVRGLLTIRLEAQGASRPLHSGLFGNVAPNPAWALVHALASLRSPDGRISIAGFHDQLVPVSPSARRAAESLPKDIDGQLGSIGSSSLDRVDDASLADRTMFLPSLSINGLDSGDLDRTIIPQSASARVDFRLVPNQDPLTVFAQVQEHLARCAPEVSASLEGAMRPSRTPVDNAYAATLAGSVARVTGSQPLVVPSLGASLPDYVWTEVLGVPSIGIPLANFDQANHAPNENIEITRYLTGVRISLAVLQELGRQTTGSAPASDDAR